VVVWYAAFHNELSVYESNGFHCTCFLKFGISRSQNWKKGDINRKVRNT